MAKHSFFLQLAGPDAAPVRAALEEAAGHVGGHVAARWGELLTSFDNRRFYQGAAEAAIAGWLRAGGWRVTDLAWPGPGLLAHDGEDGPWHVAALSFLRGVRPGPDLATRDRLRAALNRVGARTRIGLVLHRWLPPGFDPEPVRQAISLWLRDVERGAWNGRFAAYEDEHVALEFVLTGERCRDGEDVVAFAIGPFEADRTLASVSSRLLPELEALRLSRRGDEPVVVVCVGNQPWRLPETATRVLLYGLPSRQTAAKGAVESTFGPTSTPGLLRDPLYARVSAVAFAAPEGHDPLALTARLWLNPWASTPLPPGALVGDTYAVERWDDGAPVMAWRRATSTEL